ncbi:hypothetical protein [Longimicrobium sp.]|uniref:hypothetical protein n=1 Tax=Longimicrobium sp. TaxID=2029185 RepID=UPI002C6AE588|nr:hypothetical protein [Longimicrobium sp.]HSU16506.1 hypothetical protein [Longimicrobium sp.]
MRRIGGFLAVGAVMLSASSCAPMMNGLSFSPGCSAMQARAYHTTSQFTSRQRVSAIQSRYSNTSRNYAGPIRGAQGWNSLASGECR